MPARRVEHRQEHGSADKCTQRVLEPQRIQTWPTPERTVSQSPHQFRHHSLRSSRKSLYQLPIYIYVFSIGITVVSRCRVLQSKSGMLHYFTLRRFLHTPQTRHADTSRAQSRDLASHCHTCLFSLSTCMFTVWLPSTISPLHYILLVRVDRA